jgi:DNA polymerase III subunit alpha
MWNPINVKTTYSIQKGFCQPDKIAERCKEQGFEACAINDLMNMSGVPEFHKACKSNGIKPIIGCDFEDFSLFAKNKQGYFELIQFTSGYNSENFKVMKSLKELSSSGNVAFVIFNDTSSKMSSVCSKMFGKNFYNIKQDGIYYVDESDAEAHRVMILSGMKINLKNIRSVTDEKWQENGNKKFFDSTDFYLKERPDNHKEIQKLVDSCEDYEITAKPMLPEFQCPDGLSQDDYLKHLCREGWCSKLTSDVLTTEEIKQTYLDRVKLEMDVIFNARLSGYFLIVQDIVRYVRERGWIVGPGRGSAAGSLVSYLIGITNVDPIKHDLLFERFYNEGRNTKDNISLPDIDLDVPPSHRDEVIDYIKDLFGEDKVAQVITFTRLQGKSALREVLSRCSSVGYSETNEITDHIPETQEISDKISASGESSVIMWALKNNVDNLKSWCFINDHDELQGDLSREFELAIKLEGSIKSKSTHACGVVISKNKLSDICPVIDNKSGDPVAAFEMQDLESQGHVKFDILGLNVLTKIMEICNDC